jgi:hypothetical protein
MTALAQSREVLEVLSKTLGFIPLIGENLKSASELYKAHVRGQGEDQGHGTNLAGRYEPVRGENLFMTRYNV